MIMGAWPA
uniref:Uncharacterized protein n=1 Tax=Anguilla anguilla TaxID=7936 RepID=A0A0E9TZM2_ANGAN